jgi:hypothetical protein
MVQSVVDDGLTDDQRDAQARRACPKCGGQPGRTCSTTSGAACKPHAARYGQGGRRRAPHYDTELRLSRLRIIRTSACPTCGAPPDEACVQAGASRPRTHAARLSAAQVVAAREAEGQLAEANEGGPHQDEEQDSLLTDEEFESAGDR